jgi:hypothetical protein
MKVRTIAGWTVILAASGLAAMSGNLAYHGFESMIPIPFAGWIGPFVAASLIGLGIAVECEIKDRRWIAAAVLGTLLAGAAWLDKHSGHLALKAQVEAAAQVDADRKQAYDTAFAAMTDAKANITRLESELAVMTGPDTKAAQQMLGVIVDGKRGPDTVARMQAREASIRKELERERGILDGARPVVAAGAPVSTLPFTLSDAELYATLITTLAVILAFAGSWIAHPREDLEKVEAAMDALEQNVVNFEKYLDAA